MSVMESTPPAPVIHRPIFEYLMLGDSDGVTDLSSTVAGSYFNTSRVQCNSPEAASLLLRALKKCRGKQIVDCLYVDGSEVLIERTGYNVQQLFLGLLAEWKSLDPAKRKSWWLHIRTIFYSVFRNIVQGLSHAYSSQCFSGRLLQNGVSILDGKTRLSFLQFGGAGFTMGVRKDLHDLRSLMINALLLHRDREDRVPAHFEEDGIPGELATFVQTLAHVTHFEPKYLEWLLDDSSFWTGAQKSRFIRKLWERIDSLQSMDFEKLDVYMEERYPSWEIQLNLDDPSYLVKEHIENERMKHCERTYTRYSKEGPTKGITHIYRGCLEHYDSKTYVQNRIGKEKVSEKADTMLSKGVCSELRKACEMYWWDTQEGKLVRDKQVDFLLSKKDF